MASVPVSTPEELGAVLRLVRKAQGVRADDLASSAGVGPVFVLDVEHGKPTVQLGKVLGLLKEAGIEVLLELPESVVPLQADTPQYREAAAAQRLVQAKIVQRLVREQKAAPKNRGQT